MSRLSAMLKLDVQLQARHKVYLIVAVAVLAVAAALNALFTATQLRFFMPVIVLGSVSVTTVFLVGVLVLLERGEGMLDARAEPGAEQHQAQGREAARPAGDHEAGCRHRRAGGQHDALAEALGQQASGDLEERHAPAVQSAQEADLGERKVKLDRPQGEEDVDDVGEAIVQEVRRARQGERGRARSLHRPSTA